MISGGGAKKKYFLKVTLIKLWAWQVVDGHAPLLYYVFVPKVLVQWYSLCNFGDFPTIVRFTGFCTKMMLQIFHAAF